MLGVRERMSNATTTTASACATWAGWTPAAITSEERPAISIIALQVCRFFRILVFFSFYSLIFVLFCRFSEKYVYLCTRLLVCAKAVTTGSGSAELQRLAMEHAEAEGCNNPDADGWAARCQTQKGGMFRAFLCPASNLR